MNNDLTVFVSSGMLSQYRDAFDFGKAIVVENGYVRKNARISRGLPDGLIKKLSSLRAKTALILAYVGSGSVTGQGHKDFRKLLDLIKSNDSYFKEIGIVAAGNIDGLETYEGSVSMINVGTIPNDSVDSLMEWADVGLVVHSQSHEAPAVMGGKLYDYVGAGKPVWCLVPPNAESIASFLAKHNKGYSSNIFEIDDIDRTLKQVLRDKKNGQLTHEVLSAEEASLYSRDTQFSYLLPYIDQGLP